MKPRTCGSAGRVAVKFLPAQMAQDSQLIERFQREARDASALNHPNICTIHAIEQYEREHFLVMERLEGQTLAQLMDKQPFPIDRLLLMAIQIANALESAHARGIVHRDIKPANLFVTDRGQVKVLDFGLAKVEGGKDLRVAEETSSEMENTFLGGTDLTSPGSAVGTVSCMSPEQARGQLMDARTDLVQQS
jgi:serine/threonine protein kinase